MEVLRKEMGCGSGMSCWRRLSEWQQAGVWKKLHQVLLDRLGKADKIVWSRALLDSATVPAQGANKPDRMDVTVSATHVRDVRMLEETIDVIEPIKQHLSRPRKRPEKFHEDKACDSAEKWQALRLRGIKPRIARRGIDRSEKLGRSRWVVERTHSWLNRYRRLKIRSERGSDIHLAFLYLGCALIC